MTLRKVLLRVNGYRGNQESEKYQAILKHNMWNTIMNILLLYRVTEHAKYN